MITDLRLQHFRSYTDASFDVGDGVNIIVGPNASGKTNLLEAVLVVAQGGSYRAKDTELVQHGEPWMRLDADTVHGRRVVKLQNSGGDRWEKSFEIDGQNLSRLTLGRSLPVVLFEPDHLLLLSGSPDLRRNFLDDLLERTVVGFGATRRHYRRVLSHRNALLKRRPRDIHEQLFVWNLRLSELGGKIARERSNLVQYFAERASGLYSDLAAAASQIELGYATQFVPHEYETSLLRKLETSIDADLERGFTAYGPHRDDLSAAIGGHVVQDSASRGEARTLVLALKMLELQLLEDQHPVRPILLLDDVFSELDGRRRQALTRFVQERQTFITTTDADMVVQHFSNSTVIPVTA